MKLNFAAFVSKYIKYAMAAEEKTRVPHIAILAQAALESGWGQLAIGNNLFGIKYNPNINYKYRRLLTVEYSKNENAFPNNEVLKCEFDEEKKLYKYHMWSYFADYDTPLDGFIAHASLLINKRYKHALEFKNSPYNYLNAVWKAGYSTDPNYMVKMKSVISKIEEAAKIYE